MLITGSFIILSSIAITLRRDKSILYNRSTISVLLVILLISLTSSNTNALGTGVGLYGGLFHLSSLGHIFHNLIYLITGIIILLTAFFARKVSKKSLTGASVPQGITNILINKKSESLKIIEYPLILMFIITGATFLINSSDIVSIFLCIELQSYGLYLLAALYRNSEISTGASLTYFLLGGMSSCFILLGTALLYTNSGITNLEGFYIINNIWEITNYNSISIYQNNYINYSLIVMIIGFLFKISAAPFHFWSPDVYDAIPTIVTTFVAIIAKISILVFLFEIVHYTSNSGFGYGGIAGINGNFDFFGRSPSYILLLSSLLSLIVGTVLGLNQFRIKRLYAYSTISHLGFILLALSLNSVESIQAFIFYLIQYSVSNLNAFIILITIGFSLYTYTYKKLENELFKDIDNSPVQFISQLKGYFYINPFLAISLAITIFSFVGIPPLLGFFGKQMVLSAAMDNGLIFISLVAILTSVISAVYYLNLIKNIFFENSPYYYGTLHKKVIGENKNENENGNENSKSNITVTIFSAFSVSISVLTLLISAFLILQQDILNITNLVSIYILNI